MRYDIDSSFIHKELNWKQSVSFEEGIAKTVQWYKDHQAWWEAFSKRFTLMRDQGMYNLKSTSTEE